MLLPAIIYTPERMHYWMILNSSPQASLKRVSRTILSLSRVETEEKILITDQLKSTSTVGPTSSSVSSTLFVDLSFSTGGGGGTSILEGVMTPDFSSCRPRSPRRTGGGELPAGPDARSGAVGDETGEGNLNSRFIVPLLLFLFVDTSVVGGRACAGASSAVSSGVGSNAGWLTKGECVLGGEVDSTRGTTGMEARLTGIREAVSGLGWLRLTATWDNDWERSGVTRSAFRSKAPMGTILFSV